MKFALCGKSPAASETLLVSCDDSAGLSRSSDRKLGQRLRHWHARRELRRLRGRAARPSKAMASQDWYQFSENVPSISCLAAENGEQAKFGPS